MSTSPRVVLVGPKGSGKSTLARCLAALPHAQIVDPTGLAAERAALAHATAVVFVIGATDGIDAVTTNVWREVAAAGLPRAVVVTKLDAPRADFDETCALIGRLFDPHGCVPLALPVLDDDDRVAGFLDLVTNTITQYADSNIDYHEPEREHEELTAPSRQRLEDSLAAVDLDLDGLGTAIGSALITPIVGFAGPGCVGREEVVRVISHLAAAPSSPRVEWPGPITASGHPGEVIRVVFTFPEDYARDVTDALHRIPGVEVSSERPGDGTCVVTAAGTRAALNRVPIDVHGMTDGTSRFQVEA